MAPAAADVLGARLVEDATIKVRLGLGVELPVQLSLELVVEAAGILPFKERLEAHLPRSGALTSASSDNRPATTAPAEPEMM